MQSQPGEVCFPGGHVERGENPRDTALRETFEEIGVPIERIEVIGQGDTLYGYANYTPIHLYGDYSLRGVSTGKFGSRRG